MPQEIKRSQSDFASTDASFVKFWGGQLSHTVAVLSSNSQLISAVSWVLHLIGCRNVFQHTQVNDASVDSIIKEAVELVLCDLEFGETLLNSLGRQASNFSSVVVLLAPRQLDRARLSELLKRGAVSYITKPVRVQALRGMVVKYLKGTWNSERQEEAMDHYESRYEKIGVIGIGTFGEVSSVRRNRDGKYFALKEISMGRLDARTQQRILNELQLHRSFSFPCIVRAYSSWLQSDTACLLMEFISVGSLSNQVQKSCRAGVEIPDPKILEWFGQILLGLLYLHSKGVLHRDLKLDNILGPDGNGCLKLSDFGMSTHMGTETCDGHVSANLSFAGTTAILAPERCEMMGPNKIYGPESDLWSLGVVIYELVTLRPPFASIDQILRATPAPFPASRSAPLHDLVTGGLLQKRAADRPCIEDLVRNSALSDPIYDFLAANKLLYDASVLEVIDVLPGRNSQSGRGRIEISPTDVVSLYEEGNSEEIRMELSLGSILGRQSPKDLSSEGSPNTQLKSRTKSSVTFDIDADASINHGFSSETRKKIRAANLLSTRSSSSTLTVETGITELEFKALEKADDSIARVASLENVRQRGRTENWLLDPTSLKMGRHVLGRGAFGVVHAGELYGTSVALKLPKEATVARKCDDFLANELRVLRHVRHPAIVGFCGACVDQHTGIIVLALERVIGSKLGDFMHSEDRSLDAATRYKLLLDICNALRYLHSERPSIVHGDLKDSNILIEKWCSRPRPKLLDFGLSRMLTKHVNPLGGTLKWMAPEIMLDQSLSPTSNVDVFSFGRLAYLIATGIGPLGKMTGDAILKSTLAHRVPPLQWPPHRGALQEKCKQLTELCLEFKALLRPSMADVEEDMKGWDLAGMTSQTRFREEQKIGRPLGPILDWFSTTEKLGHLLIDDRAEYATGSKTIAGRMKGQMMRLSSGGMPTKDDSFRQFNDDIMSLAIVHKRLVDLTRAELMPDALASIGSFGVVVPAYLEGTLVSVRIPRVPRNKIVDQRGAQSAQVSENELIRALQVKHPNIAALYGLGFQPGSNRPLPVLEWVEGLPLPTFVAEADVARTLPVKCTLLLETLSAFWYLHDQNPPIVHGNLKGTGIMVEAREGRSRAKLIDWGWSRYLSCEGFRSHAHTNKKDVPDWLQRRRRHALVWMAPELLDKGFVKLMPSADIFSLGRVSYMIIRCKEPFKHYDNAVLETAAKKMTPPPLDWSDEGHLDSRCRLLTERCCNRHESVRPSAQTVYGDVRSWPPATDLWQINGDSRSGPSEGELGETGSALARHRPSNHLPLPSISEAADDPGVPPSLTFGDVFEYRDGDNPLPTRPPQLPRPMSA